jgi:hypothetical protein
LSSEARAPSLSPTFACARPMAARVADLASSVILVAELKNPSGSLAESRVAFTGRIQRFCHHYIMKPRPLAV